MIKAYIALKVLLINSRLTVPLIKNRRLNLRAFLSARIDVHLRNYIAAGDYCNRLAKIFGIRLRASTI